MIKRAAAIGASEHLNASAAAYDAAAKKDASTHLTAIEANADGSWIESFLPWHDQFSISTTAKPVLDAFGKLEAEHTKEATRLYTEARKAFRERKTEQGWEKHREIVQKHYASPQYRTLVDSVAKHFAE